jgi:nucleoside-diphosphate-sugar epimerase
LLAARDEGVRRVLFASSSSVYGTNPTLPKSEELAPEPISPYAVAKLACEGYCRSFGEVYGLEAISLRYFNVFGPRQDPRSQYAAVIPNFMSALLAGERPTIFGDGEQSRDFTYVENVVDANVQAMDSPAAAGHVYNVACGERITLNQLFGELRDLIGREVEPIYTDPRPGDVRHSLADVSRATKDFGYEPRITISEGLRRTLSDYDQEAAILKKLAPAG